jgi:hypothetical protein
MASPYQVFPGQLFTGAKVYREKVVFGRKLVVCDGIGMGGNVSTVAAVASVAGTGAAISAQAGYDYGGSFVLTGGTSMAAGSVATVTFGSPLGGVPVSVLVSSGNQKAGAAAGISAGAVSLSATGFTVFANTAGSLSGQYLVSYMVLRPAVG